MTHPSEPTHPDRTHDAHVPFPALVRESLAEEHEAAPVAASGLGLTGFDARLDDLSQAAFERRLRQSATWRGRFQAVPDAGLSHDERIVLH